MCVASLDLKNLPAVSRNSPGMLFIIPKMVLTEHKKIGSGAALTKPKHKLGTQGRKPRSRSTKAELDRERMTAKVIVCLVSGKTIEETARELDVSFSWVERIRKELPKEFSEYFSEAKSNEISSLIEQMLRAQLKSMIRIVEVTEDELWLKAQRAPELATFFGVVNDKAVRVLAAIERANERDRMEQSLINEVEVANQAGQRSW